MKITRKAYNQIVNAPNDCPHEVGGILGGCNGIIYTHHFDEGQGNDRICSYTPNVLQLNLVIKRWQEEGIMFMGMYHTHFWNVNTLSSGDKNYIDIIMKSMPISIKKLYFPIVVLPEREMTCYVAQRKSEDINLKQDDLFLI